jgi:hypothetical protein
VKTNKFLKLIVNMVSSNDCSGIGVENRNNRNAGLSELVVSANGRIKSALPINANIVTNHLMIGIM